MKKIYSKCTLLLFLFISFQPCFSEELKPFGIALALSGEVFVTRGIIEFDAKIEESFYYQDSIETGEDGSVQISFDSSFLSIGPNTSLTIEKNVNEKGEEIILIELEEGQFRSKIIDLPENQFFEIETESKKLRVHGTDFVTSFKPDQKNNFKVSVLQGKVGVTSPDGEDSGEAQDSGALVDDNVVFVSRRQSSNFGQKGSDNRVENLSDIKVDEIRTELPVPGDDEAEPIFFADLGTEGIEITELATQVKSEVELSLDTTQSSALNPAAQAVQELNSDAASGFKLDFFIDAGQ